MKYLSREKYRYTKHFLNVFIDFEKLEMAINYNNVFKSFLFMFFYLYEHLKRKASL